MSCGCSACLEPSGLIHHQDEPHALPVEEVHLNLVLKMTAPFGSAADELPADCTGLDCLLRQSDDLRSHPSTTQQVHEVLRWRMPETFMKSKKKLLALRGVLFFVELRQPAEHQLQVVVWTDRFDLLANLSRTPLLARMVHRPSPCHLPCAL